MAQSPTLLLDERESATADTAEALSSVFEAKRRNLADIAYDRLLDLIITRKMPGGVVLQERLVSSMLAISRTPAREALFRLESEGFLTRAAGRGLVVKEISVRDLVEILHIRKLLEVESISLAIDRISKSELDSCEEAIHRLLETENADVAHDWEVDDMFHEMVARQSGNDHIVKMVSDLRMKTRIFNMNRVPERYRAGHFEHLEMIEFMRCKDKENACRRMGDHLDNVKKSIVSRLTEI